MLDIRVTTRVVDIPLHYSSSAKSESIVGIESDRLIKIGNGLVVIAFVRINYASVPKGVSALGIESDRLVKIGEGSFVVPFLSVSDATVAAS